MIVSIKIYQTVLINLETVQKEKEDSSIGQWYQKSSSNKHQADCYEIEEQSTYVH